MRRNRCWSHLAAIAAVTWTALPLAAAEIWVTNEKDDTISVIDLDTLEVTRTIPTGQRPRGITFSKDYSRVYVCASDSDTVQVIDPETGEILHELPSGEDPEQFVLHPNDRHLYIANEDDAVTTVVDTQTRKVVAQISVGIEPEGMAVSPDGKIAITTSETTNMAHWIDTETRELFANTLVDSRPRHAEFRASGGELWVSSEIGGTITVFDTASQNEKGKISFEVKGVHPDRVQPVGFEFTEDENIAFVALGPSNHVAVVNTETLEVEDYILVGRRVWHMAFSPDKSRLFTTNGVSGDVTVIDVAQRTAIKSIKVAVSPGGRRCGPDDLTFKDIGEKVSQYWPFMRPWSQIMPVRSVIKSPCDDGGLRMFRTMIALLLAMALPVAAETTTRQDAFGTLNPQDTGFGRVMRNIDSGITDMTTCATGYYITKSGRHAQARRLFQACAEAGYTGAMTWMSQLDNNGLGATYNPDAAADWDRRAAEAGDPVGKFNYGLDLLRGHGVAVTRRAVAPWLTRRPRMALRLPAAFGIRGMTLTRSRRTRMTGNTRRCSDQPGSGRVALRPLCNIA